MPQVFANGHNFYYEQLGTLGDPLLFLSGLGGDHRAFRLAQRHFSSRFRTFAMDARDVGRSDRCATAYTTAEMANDVAALLEDLELPPAHIVGHSLGGLVAQELAIQTPHLVRSLILMSTHAGADPWRRAVLDSWVTLRRQLSIGPFTRVTLPWLVAPSFYQHAGQIEGLIRFAERDPWPQDPEAFARQAQAAADHNSKATVRRIRAPTLVLAGACDLVNPPRFASELAELLPQARMEILPDIGHMPHIEDKNRFRQSLEHFLTSIEH